MYGLFRIDRKIAAEMYLKCRKKVFFLSFVVVGDQYAQLSSYSFGSY